MKWSLAAALFTATGLASPIVPAPDVFPYRLRLQSRNEKLNGQYLSTNGTTVGVFRSGSPAGDKPLEVYTITDKKTGLVELHTYPAGDRLLALIGESNGLLSLANLPNPASIQFQPGTTCDWKSFRLGGGNAPAPGRPGNAVTYAGAQGTWAAFPAGNTGDWTVSFKGVEAVIPSIDMPIDVVYVPAYDADTSGEGLITIA